MKTIYLFLGLMLATMTGCGGAPFTGAFSESGTAEAGASGDAALDPVQAGAPDDTSAAGAGAAAAPSVPQGGAPAVSSAGAGSAPTASAGSDTGSAGAAPVLITSPCGDDAVDISDHYFSGMTGDAACYRTKEDFNTLRFVMGNPDRDVRVNGGSVLHCTEEPSDAWGNVCTAKGDFSAADAHGYHYIQVGSQQYGAGALIWATEPDGEPCSSDAFGYSKDAAYNTSDRVTASCEGSVGTCEWRCMSDSCSGVSSPKSPKWELVKSCSAS